MTLTPGLYAMPLAEYLADPCDAPSLSHGIAHALLTQSPRHAAAAHPRLNPDHEPDEAEALDLGKARHAMILEGQTDVVFIDAPDYRTKDARIKRDDARARGAIPILRDRWADVLGMDQAVRAQLSCHEPPPIPFTHGQPEQTLIWQEPNGVWCRARCDWLSDDRRLIEDLKTTEGSAHPAIWSRRLFDAGYDLQAALYVRGAKKLFGVEADFRFIVAESTPPYGCSVIALDPEAHAFATQKILRAIEMWGECLATNTWPGYPTRVCYAEAPPWAMAAWEMRAYYEVAP